MVRRGCRGKDLEEDAVQGGLKESQMFGRIAQRRLLGFVVAFPS